MIEIYDLNPGVDAKLSNLSTRAFVSTDSDVVIGGFLLSGADIMDRVIVRGIGPSLAPDPFPVGVVLANPALELRDVNGALIMSNDDWRDDPVQAAERRRRRSGAVKSC